MANNSNSDREAGYDPNITASVNACRNRLDALDGRYVGVRPPHDPFRSAYPEAGGLMGTAVRADSEIDEQINLIIDAIGRIDDSLVGLFGKLAPVMADEPPANPSGSAPMPCRRSPAARRLQEIEIQLSFLWEAVDEKGNRVML